MTELQRVQYREFDREYFEQGVWGQMRRIALSQEGNVVGIHHPDNTDLWEDGGPVDWEEYEDNGWNCMVQIPKFYYRTFAGTYMDFQDAYRLEISSTPRDGFKLHPAFERVKGVNENYQYISAYMGWVDEIGRLRSLPNKTLTGSITIVDSRIAALNNGNGQNYSQQDYYLTTAVQMLYLSEYGSWNAREKIGTGGITRTSGLSNQYGNSTFGNSSFTTYRGVEMFYGNMYTWVDGININNYQVYIAKNGFESDKFDDNYIHVENITIPTSGASNVSDIHKLDGEFDWTFIPSEKGGSIDENMAGHYSSGAGARTLSFGGFQASIAGAFSWHSNQVASSSNAYYGCRLQYLTS